MQQETYKIIGVCMEVHRILGRGFLEIVYKDAIEYEFRCRQYFYEREKDFRIQYKEIILPHKFFADFVVFYEIVLEVKAQNGIADDHTPAELLSSFKMQSRVNRKFRRGFIEMETNDSLKSFSNFLF